MSEQQATYTNLEKQSLENAEVEVTAEIPADILEQYKNTAIKNLGENVEVPGFRKGHVPEDVLEQHVGEEKVLWEAAELALNDVYPEILRNEGIQAIGRPQITVTKMAKGNPLGFSMRVATVPQFELPNYRALAQEALSEADDSAEVTDQEVEDVIYEIRKTRAQNQQQSSESADGAEQGQQELSEDELPELTDEFVQSLGEFTDVLDFRQKIRQNLEKEKQQQAHQKRRGAVGDKLIDATEIPIPDVLVQHEQDKIMGQFKDDVAQAGMEFEQYLQQIGKSEEDLRGEWRNAAERRAKLQLILNKVAAQEDIHPDEQQVQQEVNHLLEQYPEADPERTKVYVQSVLTNEQVLQFLEGQDAGNSSEQTADTESDSTNDQESQQSDGDSSTAEATEDTADAGDAKQ
jgi:trigger factor